MVFSVADFNLLVNWNITIIAMTANAILVQPGNKLCSPTCHKLSKFDGKDMRNEPNLIANSISDNVINEEIVIMVFYSVL